MGIHCTIPPTFAYEAFHNEKLRKKDLKTKPHIDHYKNNQNIFWVSKVIIKALLEYTNTK